MTKVEPGWKEFLDELRKPSRRRLVYVIGRSDSGKTTFCRFLVENLSRDFRTAYVDCDPGQSVIGPPATIGFSLHASDGRAVSSECLHFVGSTSPRRHLLQTLSGIKKLAEKSSRAGARRVILDSSGFVLGTAAREFQFNVIDLLRPHHIVAFQENRELEHLLANFAGADGIGIHRMPISDSVVPRPPELRQEYRERKFREYFEGAAVHELGLERIGLHGEIPVPGNEDDFGNRLMALCDGENFVVVLGITQGVDPRRKRVAFLSPPFDRRKVSSIQFGSIRVEPSGSHSHHRLSRDDDRDEE